MRSSLARRSALALTAGTGRAAPPPIRNPRRPPSGLPPRTERADHVAARVEDDGAAAAGPDHWGGPGTRARVPTRTGVVVRILGVARPRVSHRARVVAAPASERAPATERETIFPLTLVEKQRITQKAASTAAPRPALGTTSKVEPGDVKRGLTPSNLSRPPRTARALRDPPYRVVHTVHPGGAMPAAFYPTASRFIMTDRGLLAIRPSSSGEKTL